MRERVCRQGNGGAFKTGSDFGIKGIAFLIPTFRPGFVKPEGQNVSRFDYSRISPFLILSNTVLVSFS